MEAALWSEEFYSLRVFRSPIEADEKEVIKLAKKLKKEKVRVIFHWIFFVKTAM